ncbi:MAG: Ig-like domain-containing protein, partial [Gammaproteobacteria bacterium]
MDFSKHTSSKGGLRLMLCLMSGLSGSVHAFDLNGDGVINILDVSLVASCYGLDPVTYPQCQVADVISDGVIDMQDVSAVAGCYGLDPATNPQCQLPDNEAPLPADTSLISVSNSGGGTIEVAGSPGSVEGNSTVSLANLETGATATTTANPDGSFMVTLAAVQGQSFSITVVDGAGNASGPVSVDVGQLLALTVSFPTTGASIA